MAKEKGEILYKRPLLERIRDSWSTLQGVKLATQSPRAGKRPEVLGRPPEAADDTLRTMSSTYEFYRNYTHLEPDRVTIYNDMDEAFQYVLISAAMEAYIEDACEPDPRTERCLKVESPNPMVSAELERLFDNLEIENRVSADLWNIGKYGDYFAYNRYSVEHGIFDIIPLEPRVCWRHENAMRELIGYTIGPESEAESLGQSEPKYKNWDITHWRLPRYRAVDPYGTPFFINIRLIYKVLKLMEEQMTIYRMNMHPDRLVFKVFTGTANPEEARRLLRNWKKELEKVVAVNHETENYVAQYGPWAVTHNIYFPVAEGDANSGVEKFPGSGNAGDVFDVEYMRDLIFAGTRVPRGYMGLEDSQGYRASDTLSQQSIKFSRGVKRLRRPLLDGYKSTGLVHLAFRGFDIRDPRNAFKLSMPPVSYLDEAHRAELYAQRMNAVGTMIDMGLKMQEALPELDLQTWGRHVLTEYSGFDEGTTAMLLAGGKSKAGAADMTFGPKGSAMTFEGVKISEKARDVIAEAMVNNSELKEVLQDIAPLAVLTPDESYSAVGHRYPMDKNLMQEKQSTKSVDAAFKASHTGELEARKSANERHFALRNSLWDIASKGQDRASAERGKRK